MGFEVNLASTSVRSTPELIKDYLDNGDSDIFFIRQGIQLSEPAYSTAQYTDSWAMLVFKSDKYEMIKSDGFAVLLRDKASRKKVKIIRDVEDNQINNVILAKGETKNFFQKIKEAFFGRAEDDADIIIYCQSRNILPDSIKFRAKVLNQNDFTTSGNPNVNVLDSIFYKARIGETAKMELKPNSGPNAPTVAKLTVKDNDNFFWRLRQKIKSLFS